MTDRATDGAALAATSIAADIRANRRIAYGWPEAERSDRQGFRAAEVWDQKMGLPQPGWSYRGWGPAPNGGGEILVLLERGGILVWVRTTPNAGTTKAIRAAHGTDWRNLTPEDAAYLTRHAGRRTIKQLAVDIGRQPATIAYFYGPEAAERNTEAETEQTKARLRREAAQRAAATARARSNGADHTDPEAEDRE